MTLTEKLLTVLVIIATVSMVGFLITILSEIRKHNITQKYIAKDIEDISKMLGKMEGGSDIDSLGKPVELNNMINVLENIENHSIDISNESDTTNSLLLELNEKVNSLSRFL